MNVTLTGATGLIGAAIVRALQARGDAVAAQAIADVVHADELNPSFIIPSVFHPDVPGAVAAAVRGS